MDYKTKTLITVLGLLLGTGSAVLADGDATGAEIRAQISGNTLQGAGSAGHYAEFYREDGTILADGYTGKWKIEGDMGCMDYGEGFSCWSAMFDGPAAIWYRDGQVDAVSLTLSGNPANY